MTLAQETPYVLGLRSSSGRNSINQWRTPDICLKELECLIAQGGRLFWLVGVDFSFFLPFGVKTSKGFQMFLLFWVLFNRKHCVFGIWKHHSPQTWTTEEVFSSARMGLFIKVGIILPGSFTRIHRVRKLHLMGKTEGQVIFLPDSLQELSPPPSRPQCPKYRTTGYIKSKADSIRSISQF